MKANQNDPNKINLIPGTGAEQSVTMSIQTILSLAASLLLVCIGLSSFELSGSDNKLVLPLNQIWVPPYPAIVAESLKKG